MAGQSPTTLTRASARFGTWDRAALDYMHGLEDERLEGSPAEKGLEAVVDGKVNVSQQCALAAKGPTVPWGAPGPALPVGEGGVVCSVQPHLQHWVQFGPAI